MAACSRADEAVGLSREGAEPRRQRRKRAARAAATARALGCGAAAGVWRQGAVTGLSARSDSMPATMSHVCRCTLGEALELLRRRTRGWSVRLRRGCTFVWALCRGREMGVREGARVACCSTLRNVGAAASALL